MFSLFTGKYGGYVKAVGLSKFWNRLTPAEQATCSEAFRKGLQDATISTAHVAGKEHKVETRLTASEFLMRTSAKLIAQKEYTLAEKLLVEAVKKAQDAVTKHVILTELIEVYYKQRAEREDALEKCAFYCKLDMALASQVVEKKAEIPSFKRLAIILEKQARYTDAIAVAEQALKLGLTDGTKGGFEKRIEKLKAKIVS